MRPDEPDPTQPPDFNRLRGGNLFTVARMLFHLPSWLKLGWRLFKDPRMPFYLKGFPIAGLLYFLSPIDLLPDGRFGPLSMLDDFGVLLYCLTQYFKHAPQELLREHLERIDKERSGT